MSLFLLLYYGLLALWIPLLIPVWRLKGGARIWALLAIAAAVAATASEIRIMFWAPSAIRVDIFVWVFVLGGLYAVAVLSLYYAHWRRTATAFGLALSAIGAGMAYEWYSIGVESARLSEVFRQRDILLFDAKFQNKEVYERYFGPLTSPDVNHPVGHWEAREGSHYSRLIINAEGRVWLFYRCGKTECHFGPEGAGPKAAGDGPESWTATATKRGVGQRDLVIARQGTDQIGVRIGKKDVRFIKADPPISSRSVGGSLTNLGAYSSTECTRKHVRIHHLWLWREGPRLFATGVFFTFLPGRRADFVALELLGEGTGDGNRWQFTWQRAGQARSASVELLGDSVAVEFKRGNLAEERSVLERKAIFQDEVLQLAPLSTAQDWMTWFRTVLTGHFMSGDVPAC